MLLSDMKKNCITMVIPPDVSLMLFNARIESFYGFSVVGPLRVKKSPLSYFFLVVSPMRER